MLDEADVYLAERDIRDLSRNGIVSGKSEPVTEAAVLG